MILYFNKISKTYIKNKIQMLTRGTVYLTGLAKSPWLIAATQVLDESLIERVLNGRIEMLNWNVGRVEMLVRI